MLRERSKGAGLVGWFMLAAAWPVLIASGCGGAPAGETAVAGALVMKATTSASAPVNGLLGEDPIYPPVRRLPLAEVGAKPYRLASGEQLRVDLIADSALSRQRQLVSELLAGRAALAGAPETVEELLETSETLLLTSQTRFVVRDPAALRAASSRMSNMRFDAREAPRLEALSPRDRKRLAASRAQVLERSSDDPLWEAANAGEAAFLAAVFTGKGDYTVTTRVRVPIHSLPTNGIRNVTAPTVVNGAYDYTQTRQLTLSSAAATGVGSVSSLLSPETWEGESVTAKSKFVNGFTESVTFEWEEDLDFMIGTVHLEAGAHLGFGLRIPMVVSGKVSPGRICRRDLSADQDSAFTTEIQVDTVDGNVEHYKEAGMPADEVFGGDELVLNAGADLYVDADLLGFDLVNLRYGKEFDFGQSFRPPFDHCGNDCGMEFWVPAGWTNTVINLGPVSGSAQVGVLVTGEGEIDLSYAALDDGDVISSRLAGGASRDEHRLSFTTDQPKVLTSSLAALTSPGRKYFGYRVEDLDYAWNLRFVPGIKGSIKVDVPGYHDTIVIAKLWFNPAAFSLGTLHFDPHRGTQISDSVSPGEKKWQTTGQCAPDEEDDGGAGGGGGGGAGGGGGYQPNLDIGVIDTRIPTTYGEPREETLEGGSSGQATVQGAF